MVDFLKKIADFGPVIQGMIGLYILFVFPLQMQATDKRIRQLEGDATYFTDYIGNKDGQTTKEEWINVYKHLGLSYDHENPRDFTTEKLQTFVDSFKK